jgi:hypothetical protein
MKPRITIAMRNGIPPAKVTDTTVTKKDNAKMRLRPK